MRHINQEGLNLIKHFEGFSNKIYICPAGYPTIGYGHRVLKNENNIFQNGVTPQKAENILKTDVQKAEQAVEKYISVPLKDNQFAALVSFTFNVGINAFSTSTLRHLVNQQNHNKAAEQFLRWIWAGKRKLKGLLRRRQAEANLYFKN
jgi:lysozyme